MALCRACLVLLNAQDPAYDFYLDKDLADKFIGCIGVRDDLKYLSKSLYEETKVDSPEFVLKCICESCYQLVQKFYDFQCMCEESFRNFDKLISKVIDDKKHNWKHQQLTFQQRNEEAPQSLQVSITTQQSFEEIEEVYIVEDEFTKHNLGDEFVITKSSSSSYQNIMKHNVRGIRCKIECSTCGRGFYKTHLFDAHMLKHRGVEPFKCIADKCNKTYARQNLLTAHFEEAHQNYKSTSYICTHPNCNKVYSALRSLKYHIRRQHSKAKPSRSAAHICDKCGKSYGRKAHLVRHQWVHKSKELHNFECSLCDQRFYTNQNLNDHFKRRHSNKELLRCKHCGRIFENRTALSIHMMKHKRGYITPANPCS